MSSDGTARPRRAGDRRIAVDRLGADLHVICSRVAVVVNQGTRQRIGFARVAGDDRQRINAVLQADSGQHEAGPRAAVHLGSVQRYGVSVRSGDADRFVRTARHDRNAVRQHRSVAQLDARDRGHVREIHVRGPADDVAGLVRAGDRNPVEPVEDRHAREHEVIRSGQNRARRADGGLDGRLRVVDDLLDFISNGRRRDVHVRTGNVDDIGVDLRRGCRGGAVVVELEINRVRIGLGWIKRQQRHDERQGQQPAHGA